MQTLTLAIANMRAMNTSGLFDSVEFMCSLQMSAMQEEDPVYHEYLDLFADALYGKGQYRRALTYYRRALSCYAIAQANGKALPQWKGSGANDAREAAQVMKMCRCHIGMNDSSAAVKEIESIPAKIRTVDVNMMLGKLYRASNLKRLAIAAYKAVVAAQPLAMEAIQWLFSLGVEHAEIDALMDVARSAASMPIGEVAVTHLEYTWIKPAIAALGSLRLCDHTQFMVQYNLLTKNFPENVWLKAKLAVSLVQAEHTIEALQVFRQIRAVDPTCMEGMEMFGLVLFDTGQARELNLLANDMLAVDAHCPTGWLIAALFCQLKGEHEKAKLLVEKAVDIEPLPICFNIKGHILLSEGQSNDLAVIAFFQANSLDKNLMSFTGLVTAQLALGKVKDATSAAKDAITTLPKSPLACILVGQCLARNASGLAESMKAYQRALRWDPGNARAAAALAEVLASQGKLHEASLCLRSALERNSSYQLRLQFAKLLTSLGNYSEAVDQLHAAISLAPSDSTEAATELERVEALLAQKGEEEEELEDDGEDEGDE